MAETQTIFKIEEELFEKINTLKKHYGVKSDAELVKILVNEKAQQLTTHPTNTAKEAPPNNPADKQPKKPKTNRKNTSIVKDLKINAALKLWKERGFRHITLNVPMTYNGKRFRVKVLARKKGKTVAVECAGTVRPERLRQKIATLRACLPPDSTIIAAFPQTASKNAEKAAKLVEEIWVL